MADKIKGITIEFRGDATKLNSAIQTVNKESRSLDKQLREINKSLKFNPGNSDLIAQKQRVLSEEIKRTTEKLGLLKQAQSEAKKAFETGKIGAEEYERLSREILKAENQLEKFKKEQSSLKFEKVRLLGEKFKDVGQKITSAGKTMSTAITAPIVGMGAAAVKSFKEVDEGLDIIVAKTGATGQKAKELEQNFNNVYGNFPADSETVGNAIGEINTQFGLTGKSLDDTTIKFLQFSQLNGTDVTNSVQQSKQVIEAFGLTAQDTGRVLDTFNKAGQDTGVSMDKLFDNVVKGAPAFQSMGVSFETATYMMATFEQAGIDSGRAITGLTKAQVNWAKEGKTVEQGLRELTDRVKNAKTEQEAVAAASEVFGTKTGPMLAKAIREGRVNFDGLAKSASGASGSVAKTFEETKDPIDDWTTAMNNVKLVGKEFGAVLIEVITPFVQKLTEKLKELKQWFDHLTPAQQKMAVKILMIAAAVGPLLVMLGTLITSIGSIVGGIATIGPALLLVGPQVAAVVVAIMGVALLAKVIHDHWGEFTQFWIDLWNGITEFFSQAWQGIKTAFAELNPMEDIKVAWDTISTNLSQTWDGIKNTCSTKFNEMKTHISQKWEETKNSTSQKWEETKNTLHQKWEQLKNNSQNTFNNIKTTITNKWSEVKNDTSSKWENIKSAVGSKMEQLRSRASSKLGQLKNSFSTAFNNINTSVRSTISRVPDIVSNGIHNALTAVTNLGSRFWNAGANIIHSIADGIWSAVDTVEDAIEGVVRRIRDFLPFSPAKRGPLMDIHRLNFGGTISEGILNGRSQIEESFAKILQIPEINMSRLYIPKTSLTYAGAGGHQDGGITLNIDKVEVREEADIRKIANELYELYRRDKRGRGY